MRKIAIATALVFVFASACSSTKESNAKEFGAKLKDAGYGETAIKDFTLVKRDYGTPGRPKESTVAITYSLGVNCPNGRRYRVTLYHPAGDFGIRGKGFHIEKVQQMTPTVSKPMQVAKKNRLTGESVPQPPFSLNPSRDSLPGWLMQDDRFPCMY